MLSLDFKEWLVSKLQDYSQIDAGYELLAERRIVLEGPRICSICFLVQNSHHRKLATQIITTPTSFLILATNHRLVLRSPPICGNFISGSPLWVTLKSWRYSSSLFNVRLDMFKIAQHTLDRQPGQQGELNVHHFYESDLMEYPKGLAVSMQAGQSLFCRQQQFISITTIPSKSVQPRECCPSSPASYIDLLWSTEIAFNPTDESCSFYRQQNSCHPEPIKLHTISFS